MYTPILFVMMLYVNVCPVNSITLSLSKCGDVCLLCNSVSHPQFCTTVQRCRDDEACYIDEHVISGHVTYSLGCRRQMTCNGNNTLLHHSQSDVRNCTHCCHGDLCNADGCGQTAYRQDRGPICYTCDSMMTTDECDQISICGRDEACLLSTRILPSGKLYATSCQMKAICAAIHSSASQVVGKRNSHVERHVLCTRCCEKDLCNDGCGDVHVDHCSSSPCIHGNCSSDNSTTTGYTCSCDRGFVGPYCEYDEDECLFKPCHHGHCMNTIGGFTCSCYHGYTGKYCEHDIDECAVSRNCVHGFCENTPGSYLCHCHPGYYGRHCDMGHHAEYTSVLPLTHTHTGTSPGITGSTKPTTAIFHTKLTTPSSCSDFPSTLYCQTYKNSCWNEHIAYHCPHTCHVPGCPGPTFSSPPTTKTTPPSGGHCLDTVDNCAFIHSLQADFCFSRIDYARVHCRKFCRFC